MKSPVACLTSLLIVGMLGLHHDESQLVGNRHCLAGEPVCPEGVWRAVAQSHRIVVGTLAIPTATIREAIQSGRHRYVAIGVHCDQILKGPAVAELTVPWYTEPRKWSIRPEDLIALDKRQAMLFLGECDEPGSKGLYLIERKALGVRPPTPQAVAEVVAEVKSQQRLLEHFAKEHPPEEDPLYCEVKRLIDATTCEQTQLEAFNALKALGSRGVNAMILLMDDRRPLGRRLLAFRNPPDHWEEYAIYGPEVVADAISAIVGYITEEDFGTLHNGGSERERRETINGWRVYFHHCRDAGRDQRK